MSANTNQKVTLNKREILAALRNIAKGRFTFQLPDNLTGIDGEIVGALDEIMELATALNKEINVATRTVVHEGNTGYRLKKKGLNGTWADNVDTLNQLIGDLVQPINEVAHIIGSVVEGNLNQKVELELNGRPLRGQFLGMANTINIMLDQLQNFAKEVIRVSREVGTEGKLGGQARVEGFSGIWKDLTDNVNQMAANLTDQVRSIAEVTTAVAQGDLSHEITIEAQGEIQDLKNTINTMVQQLSAFASEVTRVAREVGTEGKLGGQGRVEGVSGTWKDLTDNVNQMAANLTGQVRSIAEVTTAVAQGDLSREITIEAQGEILDLKNTINTMVQQLSAFAAEVTRVAREVGTEGKLGGQGKVEGVSGTWKDLTDNVNLMASNLTGQVRNIAEVTTAVAQGDLSRKITVEAAGEILKLKETINIMVDQLSTFAAEVTRVSREVGTEGKLGGQATVEGVAGIWKDLTDNVNLMAANLTGQVRSIAEVAAAVAQGDLSREITTEAQGEIQDLKNTINTMVRQLSTFASEVTRVAREVGTDGKLGGQARVEGVLGIWKDLTDNVNLMAANLTGQVRSIAEVTTAVAQGDLNREITIEAQGEILDLKNTINTMVQQLSAFASEVTRVAREVGTDGKLGGQGKVEGVSGTWKDLTDNVNLMASNLTGQVRNIAEVTTAVAQGDLSRKITVEAAGEILKLKETINIMVDQLSTFASEVTRVSREVGTDGKLGGQARVEGVSGIWKDLTDNVNQMAANLTGQVRSIAEVASALARGDLSQRITADARGGILEMKNTLNDMVSQLSIFASEVTRVAREVGNDGKLGGRGVVPGVAGVWKDLTDNVNQMAANLTDQMRNIAEVTTAVAQGDLSRKITVEAAGEILKLKETINIMVDQLSTFASEVTRVAREVGTDGKLGGQAAVKGVSGTWRELTDNVNQMASNLTDQVRGIIHVVNAVAAGNLRKKLTVTARGEIAGLAETMNEMIDTLAIFADQVSSVAREVGVDGRLGGQAKVPGAQGVWADLTANVNELANNLTTQVRAIAEVSTAVTKGDLSRSISVEARGEVATLKDNVNEMITTLAQTTQVNQEQDWLKTNLTNFTRMLQGEKNLKLAAEKVLKELAGVVNMQHGVFYLMEKDHQEPQLRLFSSYGYKQRKHLSDRFAIGEGLVGQAADERQRILITEAPGDYIKINSGLGEATPLNIVLLPICYENEVLAVIELASFSRFNEIQISFLDQLAESIAINMNNIQATQRTEDLLRQSQGQTEELQSAQEELRQTNEELEDKARLLEEQKREVEVKNREVEKARLELMDKAEQLALSSKYKSEFLANMSHELRTPLNSLLILSQLLAENKDHNLTEKQVEFADTIHASGSDLLVLINEILDLSKIESGKISLEREQTSLKMTLDNMKRNFAPVAKEKGLQYEVTLDDALPPSINTDRKRLEQILKNLLSNAFKFTDRGKVTLAITSVRSGWSFDQEALSRAARVVAFRVADTGIGIPQDKQKVIFEAFQQADGSTARKYGGTGLGLSISREIARLLEGEIRLESAPGNGSVFTLYLPVDHDASPMGKPAVRPEPKNAGAKDMAIFRASVSDAGSDEALTLQGPQYVEIEDDRNRIEEGDIIALIVEDDISFAKIVRDMAHARGLKALVATSGDVGLAMARKYHPMAILLDLQLPAMSGWAVLDHLKRDPKTLNIPVHILSVEDEQQRGLNLGAIGYLRKPASLEALGEVFERLVHFHGRGMRNLLIVEDDETERQALVELIGNKDVHTIAVGTGEEAKQQIAQNQIDAVVLDVGLPDMTGFELLRQLHEEGHLVNLPIIVYTGKELTEKEELALRKFSDNLIIKGVNSHERLLAETSLFLHRSVERMDRSKQEMLKKLKEQQDDTLQGKTVLIIDDDVRNVFSLSTILEQSGMNVLSAENARDGIDLLKSKKGVDVVLMDIMMPGMDGLEATREIRKLEQFKKLPIIAVTAKAMPSDRGACIDAGASDYLAKPIDKEQLLSLLRVWLYAK